MFKQNAIIKHLFWALCVFRGPENVQVKKLTR